MVRASRIGCKSTAKNLDPQLTVQTFDTWKARAISFHNFIRSCSGHSPFKQREEIFGKCHLAVAFEIVTVSSFCCPQKRFHKPLRNYTWSSSFPVFNSVPAVIILGLGPLFLLFVPLFHRRISSRSCEAFRELLRHPNVWDINENLPNNFGNVRV